MISDVAFVVTTFASAHWLLILISFLVGQLIRNYLHNGLYHYPGPMLASLTDWWRFWDVYGRRPEVTHQKLHARYGDVVRLGPNTLSFADPKALGTIYGLNKGFSKVSGHILVVVPPANTQTKRAQSDFYVVQQSTVKGHSLASLFSTTDNAFHSRFRRCVNAAFSMSSLIQYEPFVDRTTRVFLRQTQRLFAGKGAGCELTRWLQFYAFDIIGEITYSKRHGFIEENKDIDGIISYLGNLFLYVAPIGQIPLLDLFFLKNPVYLKLSQYGLFDATMPVAKFARDRMSERLVSEGIKDQDHTSLDLLSKFLDAKERHPEFMTDKLVQTMAVSMAFAGSETTAISLSAVFYYLLRNPSALAHLRHEIDAASESGLFHDHTEGIVTFQEAQKLPYLDACIKEAFRMHPAAGLPLERIVPEPGAEIAGHYVKGGTIVGCSAWVIHRRKEIWGDDVDTYRPERWLVDESLSDGPERTAREAEVGSMARHMFQFGMGSRTCIGKNISLLEIYKLVPSMLRRFEISLKAPEKDWKLTNAWFVKQESFEVLLHPRELVLPGSETRRASAT